MDITPLIRADRKVIQNYKGGKFVISAEEFLTPVIVLNDLALVWAVDNFSRLTTESFALLLGHDVEILLLGGGRQAQFLSLPLRQHLRNEGIVVEIMDTGAACRTYNVLMAEGRKVAAALFPYA